MSGLHPCLIEIVPYAQRACLNIVIKMREMKKDAQWVTRVPSQREPRLPFCEFLQAGSRTENHKGPRVYLHAPALSPLDTPAFLAELTTAAFAFPLHRSGPEGVEGTRMRHLLGPQTRSPAPVEVESGRGEKSGLPGCRLSPASGHVASFLGVSWVVFLRSGRL